VFVLIGAASWPDRSLALIERMRRAAAKAKILAAPRRAPAVTAMAATARDAVARLGRFRRAGLGHWLAIIFSQALYHAVFIGVLLVLAFAFRTSSLRATVPTAIVYQSFLYLAPTPGSAGVGEASAELFFGRLLPGGSAFVVVVLFRMLTYYLHVVIGLVYLPLAGGLRDILERRSSDAR